jgi:hypothetical protein
MCIRDRPEAACPSAVGAIGPGAYQSFERGFMIYVNANNLNTIYGAQTSDSRYIAYVSQWDGTTIIPGTPPSGLFNPALMFNWAYHNTNAPVGVWRDSVGWATAAVNLDNRTIQFEDGTGAFFIDAPGGLVFRFTGPQTRLWSRVK